MQGRRREDVRFGDLPDDLQPGDYWRYLDRQTGEPMEAKDAPDNLTGGVWGFVSPHSPPDRDGDTMPVLGLLMKHTVREHEDGTISIRPGDGSSNSVKVVHHALGEWHGYVYAGRWESV